MPSGSTSSNDFLIKKKVFKQKALDTLYHPAAAVWGCLGPLLCTALCRFQAGPGCRVAEAAPGRGGGVGMVVVHL